MFVFFMFIYVSKGLFLFLLSSVNNFIALDTTLRNLIMFHASMLSPGQNCQLANLVFFIPNYLAFNCHSQIVPLLYNIHTLTHSLSLSLSHPLQIWYSYILLNVHSVCCGQFQKSNDFFLKQIEINAEVACNVYGIMFGTFSWFSSNYLIQLLVHFIHLCKRKKIIVKMVSSSSWLMSPLTGWAMLEIRGFKLKCHNFEEIWTRGPKQACRLEEAETQRKVVTFLFL